MALLASLVAVLDWLPAVLLVAATTGVVSASALIVLTVVTLKKTLAITAPASAYRCFLKIMFPHEL